MPLPDYKGESIVNLMVSLVTAMGGNNFLYPPLHKLDPSSLRDARNLALLVIDGLGYDYLTRVGAGSTLCQYLKGKITSVFPPTTATAVTTFLTATAPQQHGLTGWFMYFKELGSVIAVLPFRPRYGGASLGESGIDPATLFDHVPVFNRIDAQSYVVTPRRIAHSDFNVAHRGRARIRPYTSLQQFFNTIKQVLHASDQRKYVYAYWPDLDRLAHAHGIGSRIVAAHFSALDAAFSNFLNTVTGSETIVIVTADHGVIDSVPQQLIELQNHPALVETLMLPLCGDRRTAYCYVHPGRREQFETYVQTELADYTTLIKSEQLVEQGYFGLGQPHPRLLARIGHYTLVMRENYAVKDWVLGERRHFDIGLHGGLSPEEMYVPLIVVRA